MPVPLPEYKERVTLGKLRSGDFLYDIESLKGSGPRGGRFIVPPMRVASEVIEIDQQTGETLFANGLHVRFRYPDQPAIIKRRSHE